MSDKTTTKAGYQKVDASKINFAPNTFVAGVGFWTPKTGDIMVTDVTAHESKAGHVYLRPVDASIQQPKGGKKFSLMQSIETDTDEVITVMVRTMIANKEVKQEQIDYITDKHGSDNLKDFFAARENGYEVLHFMGVMED